MTVVAILLIALFGAVGLYLAVFEKQKPGFEENNVGTGIGQIAPSFTLTSTDGSLFSLSDYRGSVVVIDFMATWCAPCVVQMEHLRQLYSDYNTHTVVIISIDVDPYETEELIHSFKETHGENWIFASGPNVGVAYGVIYIPTLYVIDQQGRVVFKNTGVTSYQTLATEIEKLLQR